LLVSRLFFLLEYNYRVIAGLLMWLAHPNEKETEDRSGGREWPRSKMKEQGKSDEDTVKVKVKYARGRR